MFQKNLCSVPFLYHLVSLFCSVSVVSSSLKFHVPVSVPFVLFCASLLVRFTEVVVGAVFVIVSVLELIQFE